VLRDYDDNYVGGGGGSSIGARMIRKA